MAGTSPVTGNNSSPVSGGMGSNSKSLRGLNKPKCIKCGNVARSRCPFQSCKSCCAKAENPCHIHVLKTNAALPEKASGSGSTPSDHQSTESSSSGATHRIASLRQLSNSFAQFNNLQSPLRSRRPLTKKEAAVVNEWRYKKVREYKEGVIETENKAFDRYMQNISLLEEVLAVNTKPQVSDSDPTSADDNNKMVLSSLRIKQRSNPVRSENLRKRVRTIVDQGLEKLRKIDLVHADNEASKQNDLLTKDERVSFWSAERESSMNDLLERLSKARNEEDLKSCLEIKSQLFDSQRAKSPVQTEVAEVANAEFGGEEDVQLQSDYSPPKWFLVSTGSVDQDTIVRIDSRFSSPEGIELL